MAKIERDELKNLIRDLNDIGAIKFGSFKLKSGILSPIYIDLRVTISYPQILKNVAELMWKQLTNDDNHPNFELICGVPYTALPFATVLSLEHNIPLLIRRKEGPKEYGTKKAIEGVYNQGQKCLVIEDLVTTGGSVIEVVQALKQEGLVVNDIVVFLDREQGAQKEIQEHGCTLHSVLKFSEMLLIMEEEDMIDKSTVEAIKKFLEKNQKSMIEESVIQKKDITYGHRAELCKNMVGSKLLRLMETKKTNLCIAADVTKKEDLIRIAKDLGPEICVLKTHIDIIEDFDNDLIKQLKDLAQEFNFLIFEDRKFADIGNTVKLQYQKGIYHIVEWADMINAHVIPGEGIIQGLKEVGESVGRGLILLAEMSSMGSLATDTYTSAAVKMAEANKDFVIGFISSKGLSQDPSFINLTPGVQLEASTGTLGQQYRSIESVISAGSDIIIVGKGITSASNMREEATKYRIAGWKAYEKRIMLL